MIEAPFRARLVTGLGRLDTPAAAGLSTRGRAVGLTAIAGQADGEQAVTVPAGLLTKRLIHGVGAQGLRLDMRPYSCDNGR